MNSDNQLWWVFLVILVVVIAIILWQRKSARLSGEEEREGVWQTLQDFVARLEDCRTVDDLEIKWIHLMDCISSEGWSPEKDFGLTPERLKELSQKVLRIQSADFVKKAADGLRELFAAEAEAIDFYHNPLDIGSDPFLQELLEVWKRYRLEG